MYRLLLIFSSLIMVVLLNNFAIAEQVWLMPVPVFTSANIQANINFDSTTGFYTYNYTISNPTTNTGEIWSIDIDTSRPPNSVILPTQGLTIPRGITTIKTFDQIATQNMVPFGINVPTGWTASYQSRGRAGFFSRTDLGGHKIIPGETKGNFELISPGLPSIREVEIQPWWVFIVQDHDSITSEESERADEIESALPYKTKTLGPTAPPSPFDHEAFAGEHSKIISMSL